MGSGRSRHAPLARTTDVKPHWLTSSLKSTEPVCVRSARWKASRDRQAHCCAGRANYQPVLERPNDFVEAAEELEAAMLADEGRGDEAE